MEQSMKVSGKIISIMAEESFITQVAIYTKENLSTIWHKVLEYIDMPMVANMSATGTKINSMDLERKNGMMEVNIKASIRMLPKKDKVSTAGLMEIDTLENGGTIC
mgnify:CR=1 FL=1|jgi:hypothetical protein|tara:strand:+ start:558 stop:875 length:318 start_codon:yes stop_codon:yes gene_type:complete